jgi:hypothetical protein
MVIATKLRFFCAVFFASKHHPNKYISKRAMKLELASALVLIYLNRVGKGLFTAHTEFPVKRTPTIYAVGRDSIQEIVTYGHENTIYNDH